jgi:hypothetical protein
VTLAAKAAAADIVEKEKVAREDQLRLRRAAYSEDGLALWDITTAEGLARGTAAKDRWDVTTDEGLARTTEARTRGLAQYDVTTEDGLARRTAAKDRWDVTTDEGLARTMEASLQGAIRTAAYYAKHGHRTSSPLYAKAKSMWETDDLYSIEEMDALATCNTIRTIEMFSVFGEDPLVAMTVPELLVEYETHTERSSIYGFAR